MNRPIRARRVAVAALVLLAGLGVAAQAQSAVITGTVTGAAGEPLANANVFITEMGISIGTGAQGTYTITIPPARVTGQQVTIRARIFGYTPQARPIRITAGSQRVDFRLQQDVNRLAAVVVTGVTAGTETRRVPFTVAQVSDRDMPVPATNPLQQLQGKVPGANIVSATGRPGASQAVILRGPKSINAQGRGQEPLYIVDGALLQGTLADINPLDIESVELVKGAAAATLYGSRAAAGVIQITTKSGRAAGEGIRFTARSEYGQADIPRKFPLAHRHAVMMDETKTRLCVNATGCARTIDFEQEALRVNEEATGDLTLPPVTLQHDYGIARTPPQLWLRGLFQVEPWPKMYDPVDQLVTPGARMNNQIDATGRFGGTSFFGSVSNLWEEGAIRYLKGFRRNTVRLNVDQQVGGDWTFGLRTFYARSLSDGWDAEQGTGFFRLTRTPVAVNMLRTDRFGRLLPRSNILNQGAQNSNPAYIFSAEKSTLEGSRFLGNVNTRYTPFTWLDLGADVSYDRSDQDWLFLRDRGFRITQSSTANLGFIQRTSDADQSFNSSVNATARQTWRDLNLRYTTRYTYEQQDFNRHFGQGSDIVVAGLVTSNAATTGFGIGSTDISTRAIGIMGGVNAEYKDRYIVDVLGRRDGTSLFGAANRWANYGRASVAWRAAQEPWWFAPDQVDEFKLRASIGTAGNRPAFAAQYETFTIGAGGVLQPNTLGNRNLRPETETETEVGLDAQFFRRVGLTVNYAYSLTRDQILPVPPPAGTGFANQWQNAGTLENRTWELSLNLPVLTRQNLNWSWRLNYDRNRAFIKDLAVAPFYIGTDQQGTEQIFRIAPGERFPTFYGRKFIRGCSQLPTAAARAQCGPGLAYQANDQGYVVWVGAGNSPGDGIRKNLWQAVLPASQSPWAGIALNWGMPLLERDTLTGAPSSLPLGSALPDFRVSFSQTLNYKNFFAYAQVDGVYGRHVWNEGRHWSLGDFMDREQDQAGRSVEQAKPLGYYWRTTPPEHVGTGGFYDILGPNSHTVEKADFVKLREVTVAYSLGPVRGVGDWTISLIGRNLHTWTDYIGFDPEVGLARTGGATASPVLNAVDAFAFPNIRTYTFAVTTRF